MKDEELIRHVRNGEYRKSAKQLYAYFPVIKKYILANSGKKEDAEDVFQDALVIFFKKIKGPGLEIAASLNTYLFAISRNLWHEKLRSQKREMKALSDSAIPEIQFELKEHLAESAKAKKAFEAVSLLGEKCKSILVLFYYKKLSMTAISKQLGLGSEKMVRDQKYRCIEKAKEIYSTLN